ncbi:MAG: hypothetical protein J6F30_12640 [Cellulosilyticum sp.]|nr:hypothetical protein [Cellulosilyticum sp.]
MKNLLIGLFIVEINNALEKMKNVPIEIKEFMKDIFNWQLEFTIKEGGQKCFLKHC